MHPNKILNIKKEHNTIAIQFVLTGGIPIQVQGKWQAGQGQGSYRRAHKAKGTPDFNPLKKQIWH